MVMEGSSDRRRRQGVLERKAIATMIHALGQDQVEEAVGERNQQVDSSFPSMNVKYAHYIRYTYNEASMIA